jgi:hypothetical protein
MAKLKYLSAFVALLLSSSTIYAQTDGNSVDMADMMRSNGRIFVVVAVVVVILIGLILYLVRLDKKISKLEKEK